MAASVNIKRTTNSKYTFDFEEKIESRKGKEKLSSNLLRIILLERNARLPYLAIQTQNSYF